MLGYECRYCGKRKRPDGTGCECGASYGSLKVVDLDDGDFSQDKKKTEV